MPKTYCTYRIKVANRERVQVEKWNSLHQSLGDPSGAFRYVEKLDELTPQLSSALNNELNDSGRVRTLGETLFDILFDDVLRQDFVGFYEQVVHRDKQLLRIELVIDEKGMPEVAALPWEFMCLPERANLGTVWLSTAPEVVFSRRRLQYFAPEPIQLRKNEKLRIALVVASPPGLPLIAYEPIQQALEKLAQEKTELIELLPVLHSAGLESINEILSQEPHIVHFMGHCGLQDEQGKETGVIALVDPDSDQVLWVEAGNFSELLNQYRPGLVMLQASQSGRLSASQAFVGVASRVVQQNIPVVVAMQYDVSDTITSRFANRFYRQLAEGDPVDIAAQYGRRAISLSSAQYKKRDFATPVIFMRVENGYLFQIHKEEPPAPSSSVEMRRRLEAAMPQTSQVDRPTEIRVMVALHNSPGLRATLPDVTESGDLIQKNDAVQNDVALEFPVDSKTREPLSINIFVAITAPGFKIEQPAKSIRVSPKYDSGIITFFLTPTAPQKYGRVVVEWFGDEQKNTLLGSLTLITEVFNVQEDLSNIKWDIIKVHLAEELSAESTDSTGVDLVTREDIVDLVRKDVKSSDLEEMIIRKNVAPLDLEEPIIKQFDIKQSIDGKAIGIEIDGYREVVNPPLFSSLDTANEIHQTSIQLQEAASLLTRQYEEARMWESDPTGWRGGIASESIKSLLDTKVNFGNPADRLILLSEKTFAQGGIPLNNIYKQQMRDQFDFYFISVPVNLESQRNPHFSQLNCEFNLNLQGITEPIIQTIFPTHKWQDVINMEYGIDIGLDGNLSWRIGVDSSHLSEIVSSLSEELKEKVTKRDEFDGFFAVPHYKYELRDSNILSKGEDNSVCCWEIQASKLQKLRNIEFMIIFKVPKGTASLKLQGRVWVHPDINWLRNSMRDISSELSPDILTLLRNRDSSKYILGAVEEWTIALSKSNSI